MKLGKVNQTLFSDTPRYVGLVGPERGENGNQFVIFDETNYQLFLDANYGELNMYTRISYLESGRSMLDKVFLDLDVDKPDDDHAYAATKIPKMKEDRKIADDVLGDVVEDARRVGRYVDERNLPAVAVFSGMGVHVHVLAEPTLQPDRALRTTVRKIEDEANLQTLDERGARQGDYNRLCRLANCPRIGADGHPIGIYTVPLSVEELKDLTVETLLDLATSPRQAPVSDGERLELSVHDEYEVGTTSSVADVEARDMAELVPGEALDDQLETWLKDVLKLPCMSERLLTRNPDHDVRLNCAVLLYNCGLTPSEVEDIYSRLGWFDFDSNVTRSHLDHIYEAGYASMSCKTIQEKGLCVFEKEERPECSVFGWQGGQASW